MSILYRLAPVQGSRGPPAGAHELGVVAVVVVLGVAVGGEHHAHRAGGEVVQLAPDHGADVEPVIGAVEVDAGLVLAVVDDDVEAAGHGDDELLQFLVGMPAALRPAWHVVKVIDALDVEGNVAAALDEGEVAAGVLDLRQVDDFAVGDRHGWGWLGLAVGASLLAPPRG